MATGTGVLTGVYLTLSADHSVLLDCGEGTYGQLVRLQGEQRAAETLRRLGAIYISHLHADHHIGTELVRVNTHRGKHKGTR